MVKNLFQGYSFVGLLALFIVVLYVLQGVGLVQFPEGVSLARRLAIGPLGVVGVLAVSRYLGSEQQGLMNQAAVAYGVVAFAIWEVVQTVQAGTGPLWREYLVEDLSNSLPGGQETVQHLYQGVNAVQATADISFDIFYCLAIVLFGVLMYRHEDFGRVVGAFGVLSAAGLLVVNLWTFPLPPGEVGLWDLGPLTGVWWVLVIVQMVRMDRAALRNKKA